MPSWWYSGEHSCLPSSRPGFNPQPMQQTDFGGFPGGASGKEPSCQCWRLKDMGWKDQSLGSVLGLERSPGEGHGNPLQYSCLENPMDRGAW